MKVKKVRVEKGARMSKPTLHRFRERKERLLPEAAAQVKVISRG
jgi:hypothetical protein